MGHIDQEEVYRMKKYEIMYIVNASLEDAAREDVMSKLHANITDNGGSIDSVNEWGVKEFAYEIKHMKKGYYVVINATANNEGIHEFERKARINHNVVRFMVVKTQDEE
jgi:small subunit ribosomal protein S6